jgi:hypothetical protein
LLIYRIRAAAGAGSACGLGASPAPHLRGSSHVNTAGLHTSAANMFHFAAGLADAVQLNWLVCRLGAPSKSSPPIQWHWFVESKALICTITANTRYTQWSVHAGHGRCGQLVPWRNPKPRPCVTGTWLFNHMGNDQPASAWCYYLLRTPPFLSFSSSAWCYYLLRSRPPFFLQ